jgi:uncharacterized protein (TIGR03086 family)
MESIRLHDRALEATANIVGNVDAAQFALPTPCAEFDVLALLNHMIGGNYRFVKVAEGEPGTAFPAGGDYVRGDALTPYRDSARAVAGAWSEPARLEKTVHLPFGDFPGAFAIGIHTVEVIVHGWDLARATGQPTELDPELYAVARQHTQDIGDDFRGPGRPFGAAVEVPPDATETQRLMAWLGRHP